MLRALAGRLYVGGLFLSVDGSGRGNGAAFDLATLGLTGWDPHMGSVNGLELWQGRMLVSGGGAIPGNALPRLLLVDPVSGDRLNLPNPEAPFSTAAVTIAAGTFIVAGARDAVSPPGPTLVPSIGTPATAAVGREYRLRRSARAGIRRLGRAQRAHQHGWPGTGRQSRRLPHRPAGAAAQPHLRQSRGYRHLTWAAAPGHARRPT